MHLIKVIQGCRSLPDLQQAYSEFWQNAFTQYAEEPRRMLLVTQGAVDGIPRRAWEWRNASHIALGGLPRHASTLTQPRQGNTKANRDLILNGTQMTQLFCTSGG
jgi:hypothetical protein